MFPKLVHLLNNDQIKKVLDAGLRDSLRIVRPIKQVVVLSLLEFMGMDARVSEIIKDLLTECNSSDMLYIFKNLDLGTEDVGLFSRFLKSNDYSVRLFAEIKIEKALTSSLRRSVYRAK